jgi:hypothetical protein
MPVFFGMLGGLGGGSFQLNIINTIELVCLSVHRRRRFLDSVLEISQEEL